MKHGMGFNGKCNLGVESVCMRWFFLVDNIMHVKPLGLTF